MKPIELFVQDLCPFSNMAKAFLSKHKVPYVIRNTSTDSELRREFKRIGCRVLPTLIIDGKIYDGFYPITLILAIKRAYGIDIPMSECYVPKTRFKRLAVKNPELIPKIFIMSSSLK